MLQRTTSSDLLTVAASAHYLHLAICGAFMSDLPRAATVYVLYTLTGRMLAKPMDL